MFPSLNVIALISGGKDSLYSLLHCLQNGHNVVALANLHPPPSPPCSSTPSPDELIDLNSHMYQTVGHSLIPLYATTLQLPLYRHAISGSAKQTGRYYDPSLLAGGHEDETEDLVPLLQKVMREHPEANAVSSGAILSTYQRTRIESVALRLGLTPLAYLWQYPALPPPLGRGESLTGLLDDMAAAGCHARIVKIASGGLTEGMLWTDVTSERVRRELVKDMAPFLGDEEAELRAAVVGEGGEYETLAVDGPESVWKGGRIEVEGWEVVRDAGGVCWLRVRGAKVVGEVSSRKEESGEKNQLVTVPGLLDSQFVAVLKRVVERSREASSSTKQASQSHKSHQPGPSSVSHPQQTSLSQTKTMNPSANTLQISNLTGHPHDSIEDQTSEILNQLRFAFLSLPPTGPSSNAIDTTKILSTTLLLRSITSFAAVNTIYATFFPPAMPNPPARVAVACGESLPNGIEVSLSVLIDLGDRDGWRGLHVQGRSYWAPANIGAYSQAIAVPLVAGGKDAGIEVVHVAGQIPLMPASMEIYEAGFMEQAVLALQHLWRVGQERKVDAWAWGVAFLDRNPSTRDDMERVEVVWETWRSAHEVGTRPAVEGHLDKTDGEHEDDDKPVELDAWDLKNNRSAGFGFDISRRTVGEHLHLLPHPHLYERTYQDTKGAELPTRTSVPPLIIAEVEGLPRGAPGEWHSSGLGRLVKQAALTKVMCCRDLKKRWGHVHMIKITLSDRSRDREKDIDDDGPGVTYDRKILTKAVEVNFVTLMAFEAENPSGKSEIEGYNPDIFSLLHEIITSTSNSSEHSTQNIEHREQVPPASVNVIHSTTYVSAKSGLLIWDSVGGPQWAVGATVVPCRNLWGTAGSEDPRGLSFAVTMRVDVTRTLDR